MASTYNKMHHDLGVTYGSDVIGMMVAKDENGKMMWKEYDDLYLAQQFFSGEPSYVNVPPERRLPLSQDDWRSGFGMEVYDPEDPKRYCSSYGMDLRHKGQAILSYGATAIAPTQYAAITIPNANCEAETSWTNGARDNTHAHGGTYGWKVDNATAYQDLPWNTKYQKCYFTLQCYAWAADANNARIQIDDGVTTTSSSFHAGDSDWGLLTVSAYIGATATRLRIQMQSAIAAAAWFDDFSFTVEPLNGSCNKGIDFNDNLYIPQGNILFKLNGTGNGVTTVRSFPANITCLKQMIISGTDYLFVALGLSTPYQYMTTAEAFTVSNAATNTFQFFELVYTNALTMYGNDTNSTIRSTTNPLNGGVAWSAATQVDSDLYDITSLFTQSGALYIGKEDMPYYLDSTGAVQNDLAPELKNLTSSTSGKNPTVWLNELFIPAGGQSLIRCGTTNEFIQPGKFLTNFQQDTFVPTGRILACAADEEWMYVIIASGYQNVILAGRDEVVDGETKWVWHPIQVISTLALTSVEASFISNVYKKRLWFGSTVGSESLYYIPLPSAYSNILADANRSFGTDGYFITPYLHGNFKNDNKQGVKVSLMLGHSYDADIYFRVYYEKLGDTTWTEINPTPTFFKGTSTNRLATGYVPVDASSNNPVSTMFRLKIVGVTDTTNTSPILLWYQVDTILRPPTGTIIACTVMDVKSFATRDRGEPESGSQGVIKSAIDNAIAATYPVTIYDPDGNTKTVNFLALPSNVERRYPVRKVVGQSIEWYYNILMQVVTLS